MSSLENVGHSYIESVDRGLDLDAQVLWENEELQSKSELPEGALGRYIKVPFAYSTSVLDPLYHDEKTFTPVQLRRKYKRHVHAEVEMHGVRDALGSYGLSLINHVVSKGNGYSKRKNWFNSTPGGKQWFWRMPHRKRNLPDVRAKEDVEYTIRGLCNVTEAEKDRDVSLEMNRLGGRFGVPLRISAFEKLPYRFSKFAPLRYYTLEELRGKRLLPELMRNIPGAEPNSSPDADFTQAVSYDKGYVNAVRLNELIKMGKGEARECMKEAVRKIQAEDSTVNSVAAFFRWFLKMQANNLTVLNSQGQMHGDYHLHQLTLGGELTDMSASEKVPRFKLQKEWGRGILPNTKNPKDLFSTMCWLRSILIKKQVVTAEELPGVDEIDALLKEEFDQARLEVTS